MSPAGVERRITVLSPGVAVTIVLVRDAVEIAAWPLETSERGTLATIDELARMQLAARRLGCTIAVRDVCPPLAALLELTGLVEVIWQAEGGEQLGVEKEVEPGDPVA